MKIAAMAAHFGRDIERSMEKLGGIIERLRAQDIDLLVLPDATLGGYIGSLSTRRRVSIRRRWRPTGRSCGRCARWLAP